MGDKVREKEGQMGAAGGKREESIDISQKQVTWEDVDWPCFVDVQNTELKMAIKSTGPE